MSKGVCRPLETWRYVEPVPRQAYRGNDHMCLRVTVGTVGGQQEGSQSSRVSDTEGWR